jgi:hypothetical protein
VPSVSKAQNRFFHAVEENPKIGKKRGVSVRVAKEFLKADEGKKVGKLPERKGRKMKG